MATMLDCKTVQPRLSEYVDGVLTDDTRWNIKLHLASCAVCSRVEEELRETAGLLRALPQREPSADFEAKLAMRLADQVMHQRRPSLLDRLRDWWYDAPYARPAVTSTVALAALVPVIFFAVNRAQVNTVNTQNSSAVAVNSAKGTTLEQVWAEHASSDPFGDDSSLLLSSDPGTGVSSSSASATDDRQAL